MRRVCGHYQYPEWLRLILGSPTECPCGAQVFLHENLIVCTRDHVLGFWYEEEPEPILGLIRVRKPSLGEEI
jgi:hypothetical protein